MVQTLKDLYLSEERVVLFYRIKVHIPAKSHCYPTKKRRHSHPRTSIQFQHSALISLTDHPHLPRSSSCSSAARVNSGPKTCVRMSVFCSVRGTKRREMIFVRQYAILHTSMLLRRGHVRHFLSPFVDHYRRLSVARHSDLERGMFHRYWHSSRIISHLRCRCCLSLRLSD